MSCHGNVVRGTGTAGKHISNKVQPIPKHDDDNECKDRSPIQTPALSEKREKRQWKEERLSSIRPPLFKTCIQI